MLRFLLVLFATVIFVLLAGEWLIHDHQSQWAFGAAAAFTASFLVTDVVADRPLPWARRRTE